jgi:serine protease
MDPGMHRFVLAAALALALIPARAAEFNPVAAPPPAEAPVARLIVRLRAPALAAAPLPADDPARPTAERFEALGIRSGVSLRFARSLTGDIHLAKLLLAADHDALDATLAALRADPAVEYADPDRRRFAHATTPNDPLFVPSAGATGQWYLGAPSSTPSGLSLAAVDAIGAWDTTRGSPGIVIADLDSGVRFDHPDLLRAGAGGKLLSGYDFVGPDGGGGPGTAGGSYLSANDGDGWDPDPSDPGDWISSTDLNHPVFSGCTVGNSSWHGTRTAGILGALSNNSTGIAGIAWGSWVLPVRVLGKCGGYDSNILAAMLWAAGIPVTGAPANPYPAQILNMSLGSSGACATGAGGYADVIRQVNAQGAVVVVSAGNVGGPVDEPANCAGAIAVTGVRHVGTKVGYANLGPEVALAAPAGNCVNTAAGAPCLFSIDTTVNFGTTVPGANGYTNQWNSNVGTSFSAPIVAGIAALMLSVNGNLTPAQLATRLKAGTRPFPLIATDASGATIPMCTVPAQGGSEAIECNCTVSTCGAGLADAAGAVREASRPIAAVAVGGAGSAGGTITIDASGSAAACGASVASYAWSILPGATAPGPPALSASSGTSTSLVAPTAGTLTVELVVTDAAGLTDTATVALTPNSATTAAPARAGNKACPVAVVPVLVVTPPPAAPAASGGGGALDAATLAGLALVSLGRRLGRRRHAGARGR